MKRKEWMNMTTVGVVVGSLRKESFSQKIASFAASLFPEDIRIEWIEIGQLPLYNQDYDGEEKTPEEYNVFRRKINEIDAFLFVTPEYNRSIPAALKNALEVGSRPRTMNAWNNKPAGIISQSPGNLGGFGANHHLRQTLVALNMPVVQQPEVYLSHSATLFDDNGRINNEDTIQFLQSFIDALMDLVRQQQMEEV